MKINKRIDEDSIFWKWLGENLSYFDMIDKIDEAGLGLKSSKRCTAVINNPSIATADEVLTISKILDKPVKFLMEKFELGKNDVDAQIQISNELQKSLAA